MVKRGVNLPKNNEVGVFFDLNFWLFFAIYGSKLQRLVTTGILVFTHNNIKSGCFIHYY